MKVIDLLNKIVNGEEVPKEIIYRGKNYHVEFNSINEKNYYCDDKDNLLLENINNVVQLNDEIEEDKNIEKIDIKKERYGEYIEDYCFKNMPLENLILNQNEVVIINKINEIIDKINMMEEK